MKTTNRQKIKRLAINLAALLIITTVAFLAVAPTQFWGRSDLPADLPSLKGQVKDVNIDPKLGEINVALVVKKTDTQDDVAADTIALYKWGRAKLPPLVCGDDYPPNLCVQRWVKVTWVFEQDGKYYPVLTIGLDQMGIDRLIEKDPRGYEELNAFLLDIKEKSNGTGLFYDEYPVPPEPFTGFK